MVAPSSPVEQARTGRRDFLPVALHLPGLGTHRFVGRDVEMRETESMLAAADDVQLRAALDGLPGIGKTELARQLVARLSRSGRFPGGILWFTAESAFRLLWGRLTNELREGWLLAAHLAPAWFSTELADAIGLDAGRRRGLVRLHVLERDDEGRHQMHRLLRGFARAELPDSSRHLQDVVIAGATHLLEHGDPLLRFQRYRRDAAIFEHLLGAIPDMVSSTHLKVASALALRQLGDLQRARNLLEETLAWNLATYGDDHSEVAVSRANLAVLLRQLGNLPRASELFEQALATALMIYGEGHPEVATTRANLAGVLCELGDLQGARRMYERALRSHLQSYGDDHPAVTATRANLAWLLMDLRESDAARTLFEQALASNLRIYHEEHPEVAISRSNLAVLLTHIGESSRARPLFEQALASNLKTYGPEHPEVATTRANLALLLMGQGELMAARVLLEQALASNLKTYGPKHPDVAVTHVHLGRLLEELHDMEAALAHYLKALESDLDTYRTVRHLKVERRRDDVMRSCRLLGRTPPPTRGRDEPDAPREDGDEGTIFVDVWRRRILVEIRNDPR